MDVVAFFRCCPFILWLVNRHFIPTNFSEYVMLRSFRLSVALCLLLVCQGCTRTTLDNAFELYNAGQFEKAAKMFTKLSQKGDVVATYQLAQMNYKGQGVVQNAQEGFLLLTQSAQGGYATAQNRLGSVYFVGEHVLQDFKKSAEWFNKAAEQDDMAAQYNLATCYFYGYGVKQNYEESQKWLRLASNKGHSAAQFMLGEMLLSGTGSAVNKKEAYNLFQKAAKQKHAGALAHLQNKKNNNKE